MTVERVLTVNHADAGAGGTAVAGYRLHRSLLERGVDARLIVGNRTTHDDSVEQLRAWRTLRRPLKAALRRVGLNELDGISAFSLSRHPSFLAAQVVHYHAIHGDYFSYPVMAHLTGARPSVITLHDMWPLTGHCSFSFGCGRWRSGCGSCPHLDAFPAVERDATALEWRLKDRVWAASRLTVVSPSRWLAGLARDSMLGRFEVEVVPHGIDTSTFAPVDRGAARRALGLPVDAPVLLFGAAFVADRRKGPDLFLNAVAKLPERHREATTVALMGHWGRSLGAEISKLGCAVADFGFVGTDRLKSVVYSAADAFVFTSRADNSPLTILESLACGTPVVAFDVGGVGELVGDGTNGLLAPPEDAEALSGAIATLIETPELAARLGSAARSRVESDHPEELAARRHIELYASVIDRHGR